MITLVDVLNRHAAEQPEKIAVHFRDQSLTYAQLRRQAALLGGYLQSLGVTVGDRIMLTGPPGLSTSSACWQSRWSAASRFRWTGTPSPQP